MSIPVDDILWEVCEKCEGEEGGCDECDGLGLRPHVCEAVLEEWLSLGKAVSTVSELDELEDALSVVGRSLPVRNIFSRTDVITGLNALNESSSNLTQEE